MALFNIFGKKSGSGASVDQEKTHLLSQINTENIDRLKTFIAVPWQEEGEGGVKHVEGDFASALSLQMNLMILGVSYRVDHDEGRSVYRTVLDSQSEARVKALQARWDRLQDEARAIVTRLRIDPPQSFATDDPKYCLSSGLRTLYPVHADQLSPVEAALLPRALAVLNIVSYPISSPATPAGLALDPMGAAAVSEWRAVGSVAPTGGATGPNPPRR